MLFIYTLTFSVFIYQLLLPMHMQKRISSGSVYTLVLLLATAFFLGCSHPQKEEEKAVLLPGIWRATLDIQGQPLPFNFELTYTDSSGYIAYLMNDEERIRLDEISVQGDSVYIPMHYFDTRIEARIEGDKMHGHWQKNYVEDYIIPFTAEQGVPYRFASESPLAEVSFDGKWEVYFGNDPQDSLVSISFFEQEGNKLTGTILKTTGDYRYLAGNVRNDTLYLSTFDGEHAYLFRASMQEDGTLLGDYWSGKTYHDTWVARRNEQAELPDPSHLTFIKEGYDGMQFSFPNTAGEMVSLSDAKFQNKVVIVQLLGTWCPNCMDETKFLSGWYNQNQERGVEIIGLAYERKDDFAYASSRIQKMKEKLDVPYEVLMAGTHDKEAAAKTLPMLNHILSFPTTIFIDRNGEVREIHTGFSGPGTGKYFAQFIEEFNLLMDKLLRESPA